MLAKLNLLFPSLLALLCFVSCEESSIDKVDNNLCVIEGFIDNGDYPNIWFSTPIIPGESGTIEDNVIIWGKLTLFDGEKEVILTGGVDKGHLPPFKYYTYNMQGEPGKTYKLTAIFKNLHAEAECYMPYPTRIDNITFAPADNDSTLVTTLFFTAPQDTPAYYYLTLTDREIDMNPHPCTLGTICALIPGEKYSIGIMRPKIKIPGERYYPHPKIGNIYKVSLNRVTKEVYDFWRAFDNVSLFTASPFFATEESLPTNIRGGYGIWSAQGVSSQVFKVP